LADEAPAVRSLAVGGNNLAAALETRAARSPGQTAAMLRAAYAGLDAWRRCGSWLEHERAEYRAARSQLSAGQAVQALHHAQRCLQICSEHDAPAFERFFGHAAAALAQAAAGDAAAARAERRRALDTHARVPPDERAWCDGDLNELHAIGGAAP